MITPVLPRFCVTELHIETAIEYFTENLCDFNGIQPVMQVDLNKLFNHMSFGIPYRPLFMDIVSIVSNTN